MLKSSEIALIVNQDASRVPSRLKTLRSISRKHKIKLRMCDGPDLDHELRVALKDRKVKRLIVGGGDGSVSKAASLVNRLNNKVELAILPLGTSNYYAKSLGVSKYVDQAFEIAVNGRVEKRHLCNANGKDFLIGLNIGSTSQMFSQVSDEEKEKYGKFAYFWGIARVLADPLTPDVTLKVNRKSYKLSSTEVVVLNQHITEKIKLVPEVKGSDAHFEIITYGMGRNKLSPLFAATMFTLSFGRNQKYLKRIKATKATIITNKPLPVAIDGDSLESTPVKVKIVKTPVNFIAATE